jgi:hypothetical protein
MLYWLRRHPFPVSAFFRHSLVLTYAFSPEILEPLLPEGLTLDTYGDSGRQLGFLAIALVQTEALRPSILPAALGQDFFLSGYRIFTRLATPGHSRRGLRILRSDTDRPWMVRAGNLLTHYHYQLCQATLDERRGELHWTIRTPRGDADLEVTAKIPDSGEPAPLPPGSPFASVADARRFAGPLPYTFDYESETRSIICIRALRQEWNPRPVQVDVRKATFFQQEPFCRAHPVLANAFYVRDVPYQWLRGVRIPLEAL